jgi:alcohol dehydrogenase (cytochrome c)
MPSPLSPQKSQGGMRMTRTNARVLGGHSRAGTLAAVGTLAAAFVLAPGLRAQEGGPAQLNLPPITFTAAQAAQGQQAYAANCASCHGQNLEGGDTTDPLKGDAFGQYWGGKRTGAVFTFIKTTMPPANPGSVSDQTIAQILAYLLQANGLRPGSGELSSDPAALAATMIPRMAPAATLPAGAGGPISPRMPKLPAISTAGPLDKLTPVTDAVLRNPPPGDWLLWRRTYEDLGFSPLKQIDRSNVGDLRIAWAWTLPDGPNEATPLEHDGVIFVHSFGDRVQALDAATGDILWQYARQLPNEKVASVKRNMSIAGNLLIFGTSDVHEVALDIKSGKVVWDHEIADYKEGWQITGGPLVAKGKVIQGIAGGRQAGGCFIVALDADSGREAWRFYTIAQPGQPGGDTWNGAPLSERSGASVWTAGSYDPDLNLVYIGTGQTYDTVVLNHPVTKPGITNDGLYTDTTLAFNPDTGRLVWYFQHLPDDQWDLDWAFERELIRLPVNGTNQKLVVTSGKMALYDALDAATGKYVFSKDLGIQSVVKSVDPQTGKKTINPDAYPGDGKPHMVCPHPGGGRNWIPSAYNPDTRILYTPMVESCMDLIPAGPGDRGNLTGAGNWSIRLRPDSDGKLGRVQAVNLETKQNVWTDRQRAPQTTGILATAGGLIFAGSLDRYIRGYDDSNGETLWQARLSAVPSSCPITYTVNGKQYLAVVVSNAGSQAGTWRQLVPDIQNPLDEGSSIFVFALPDKAATKAGTAR